MHQPQPFIAWIWFIKINMQPQHAPIPILLIQPASYRAAFNETLVAQGIDYRVSPLHKQSPNAASPILWMDAHGIDTGMWPLEPRLSRKKSLREHTLCVLGTLCSLRIPGALDRLWSIWERVLVENEPLTAPRHFSGCFIDHVYQVRVWVCLAHIPADFGVQGFISGAIFRSMAAYWVDSRENRAIDKLDLSGSHVIEETGLDLLVWIEIRRP